MATTIPPNLLEIAINSVPRIRAWRFSSATSDEASPKSGARLSRNAVNTGSIGTTSKRHPRFSARALESVSEPSDEYRDGMVMPCTRSGPSASTAMEATSAESIPPDSPTTTSENPFLWT